MKVFKRNLKSMNLVATYQLFDVKGYLEVREYNKQILSLYPEFLTGFKIDGMVCTDAYYIGDCIISSEDLQFFQIIYPDDEEYS